MSRISIGISASSAHDLLTICSNAAVIGNVELLLAVLYPDTLTNSIYTRLSNAFLIGMIIGMLLFGGIVDHFGRKVNLLFSKAQGPR